MTDFWAKRLGGVVQPAPVQPPAQAPAQDALRPWWQPQPVVPVQQAQPQHTQQPLPDGLPVDPLRQKDYTTDKAQSIRKAAEPCPECGGGNYLGSPQNPNALKHCYTCGYNARFTQSMAGVSGGSDVPVKSARVQQGNTNNFNPKHVIAHIG
jgi:hypothetical protein